MLGGIHFQGHARAESMLKSEFLSKIRKLFICLTLVLGPATGRKFPLFLLPFTISYFSFNDVFTTNIGIFEYQNP